MGVIGVPGRLDLVNTARMIHVGKIAGSVLRTPGTTRLFLEEE
jgi:hypothetical protein